MNLRWLLPFGAELSFVVLLDIVITAGVVCIKPLDCGLGWLTTQSQKDQLELLTPRFLLKIL